MRQNSGFKYIALSLLLIVASINFTRTTLEIVKSSKRLDSVKDDISSLEQQKTDLQKSIDYKNSTDFVEKTAREQLNLVKPGERVYVVKDSGVGDQNSVLAAASTRSPNRKTLADREANLKAWWRFFF